MNNKKTQAIAISLLIFNLLFTGLAHAASPLAGTLIQNQATASYKDAAGIEQVSTSNVVATLIQQVAAMDLLQDQNKPGAAGNTVYFPHVLTNTGNGDDSYNLIATNDAGDAYDFDNLLIYADANQDGIPDNTTPITTTSPLTSNQSFYFVVAAAVPVNATEGQQAQLTVKATSIFDNSKQKTNTDTVTVSEKAIIEVTKSLNAASGASPSGAYTVTLTYKNTGALDARDVVLIDNLPAGMSYHADGANNHALWSEGLLTLTDNNEEDQNGISYCAYDPSCLTAPFANNQVTAMIANVPAGARGTVSFEVMIDAGLSAKTLLNIAEYQYNNGSVTVPPTETNRVPFEIIEQPGVVANGSITSNIDGTGESVTTASAAQGGTVSFDNIIWNTGNSEDSFDISIDTISSSFPAGTVFQLYKSDGFTPLLDSNSNSVVDTGLVAAGSYYKVVLKAVLPTNASGDNNGAGFDITKIATSSIDPLISNPVTDHLDMISSDSVDLTNNAALGQPNVLGAGAGPAPAPVTTETVAPGEQAVFRLFVNNISGVSRSYQLQFSNSNFVAGMFNDNWKIAFHKDTGNGNCESFGSVISSTGMIAANDFATVCAIVSVPVNAIADGVVNPIYFRVYNPITGASDIKHDAVIVAEQAALSIEPNQIGQVQPGNSIVYTHRISNNGNMPLECINVVSVDNQPGWTSLVYKDVNENGQLDNTDVQLTDQTLNPGESFPILLKLFAPANAAMGIQDTSRLTLTGYQDDGDGNPAICNGDQLTDVAEDLTTVNSSEVTIFKEQAADNNCDGVVDGQYVTTPFQVDPGRCVMYRLTAINAGATPVNNVRIDDAAPAFTQFYTAANLPNVTEGNIAGGLAGQDGVITGGSVNGVSITLQSGGKMALTFGVRLD